MKCVARSVGLLVLLAAVSPAPAQHHGVAPTATPSHHVVHQNHGGAAPIPHVPNAPSAPPASANPVSIPGGPAPILFGGGLGSPFGAIGGGYFPPTFGNNALFFNPTPVGFNGPLLLGTPFPTWGMGQGGGGGGLMLPMPPEAPGATNPARPRRPNRERARELVELGDRSFRGGNIRRAEDRFLQAVRADASTPIPHLHLAQVALVRKKYGDAAGHIRAAVAASRAPGWLGHAPDIQAIYAEPADFASHLAKLESHLQANPGDRDAWFVLGVEWFLSGRTRKAADAFQRITDRRPDEALTAFLDASKSGPPAAN